MDYKHYVIIGLLIQATTSFAASAIIPNGTASNWLYYQMGGGADYSLPPVADTHTLNLSANSDLGIGKQCGMYNPALSIQNSLNNLQNSVNNLTQNLITSATGSIAEMPMYFLAQANPTLYNLLNNALVSAHAELDASVKSCQAIKSQIAQGKNPYQDWGTLSINHLWEQHLSLTATGNEDMNDAASSVTENAGDSGVAWVQGKSGTDGGFYAGGKSQPPIHVIADTIKAGYNALLSRNLQSDDPAPGDSGLSSTFTTPADAANWITNVLGDQIITTCTDKNCTANQGGVAGRGLLPWATTCNSENQNDCTDTLNSKLQNLINGSTLVTKENLLAVSAENLTISPQIIQSLKTLDSSQQPILTYKLAQEIAAQRLLDKAFMARDLLQTGSQVPVIAANAPAQQQLQRALQQLDQNIQGISFESQTRKQMLSDTLSHILQYSGQQQQQAFGVTPIIPQTPLMENGAVSTSAASPTATKPGIESP